MSPLPPSSTLFPYTTLFRSAYLFEPALGTLLLPDRDSPVEGDDRRRTDRHHTPRVGWRDRKSTRLNSSHRCISYAVFCLKKKINKQEETRTRYDQRALPHET